MKAAQKKVGHLGASSPTAQGEGRVEKLLKSELGAIVMGARVPCVLTSRGDSEQSKLYSIALAAMLA